MCSTSAGRGLVEKTLIKPLNSEDANNWANLLSFVANGDASFRFSQFWGQGSPVVVMDSHSAGQASPHPV